MKKLLLGMFLLSLIISCKDSKTFVIPFEKSQIVINAVLRANESPVVFVGKTWLPSGVFPEKYYLENAIVKIYENDVYSGTLTHTSKGIYKLSSFKLKPEKFYVIKVEATGYTNAENAPVKIPKAIPLQSVYVDKSATVTSVNSAGKPVLVRATIQNSTNLETWFGIVADTYLKDYPVIGVIAPLEVGRGVAGSITENCIKRTALLGDFDFKPLTYKSSLFLYNTTCFASTSKQMNIVVETSGALQKPNDYTFQTADEIRVQLFSLSDEYYEYAKQTKYLEGLDYAFTEPTPNYNNVKGGYGVVVALNRSYYVLRNF